MRRWWMRVGILIAGMALSRSASADEDGEGTSEADADRLALAGLLIRDGFHDRAEAVLKEIDSTDARRDEVRYHTLWGLVHLKLERWAEAVEAFESALTTPHPEDKPPDPSLYLSIAQAWFGRGDPQRAIEALARLGPRKDRFPAAYLLAAQSHWKRGDHESAWEELDAGGRLFPRQEEFIRQKVSLLIDMSLYREAVAIGRPLLDAPNAEMSNYLNVADALRRAGQHREAAPLLEEARLRWPDEEAPVLMLAQCHVDMDHPLTAAGLYRQAALRRPALAQDAAELYRRAGRIGPALHMNAQVPDQPAKVRQRLGLLVEQERFDQAVSLQERASRLGLLEDDHVRYALAYAHFKNGDFDRAEALLGPIRSQELFNHALGLRKAMQACREKAWSCF